MPWGGQSEACPRTLLIATNRGHGAPRLYEISGPGCAQQRYALQRVRKLDRIFAFDENRDVAANFAEEIGAEAVPAINGQLADDLPFALRVGIAINTGR